MEGPERFPRLVSIACHDLRTPLATVYGFARTLVRAGNQDERTARYLGMIEAAAEQMTALLDDLGTAARVVGNRFEPVLREVDTLELAQNDDARVEVTGSGAQVETDPDAVRGSLRAFAHAALRHGPVEHVTWSVAGPAFVLSPVTAAAAPVVSGEEQRDLGSLVGLLVIGALGGACTVDGETFRVSLSR
jgi:signal transduction histidine kinase